MAGLVAEAFLSVAFGKLFELLASPECMSFFRKKKSIDDQQKLLKEKLKNASLLLNDAEEKQITDKKVKEWLDDLNNVIFRADDLGKDIEAKARSEEECESGSTMIMLKKKVVALVTPRTEFDKFVEGEMGSILKELQALSDEASTLGLKQTDDAPNTRFFQSLPAPWRDERHVYGRGDEKKMILELLLSDEVWGDKIGVLPIVGMGGLGKTTLAQLVYDDATVKKSFQHGAWVTVSTKFNIFDITKTILKQVSPEKAQGVKELAELQERLKEALRAKKFFVVLDDVWEDDYNNWDFLTSVLMSGHCRSRIIVTTRSHKVASMVQPGENKHELRLVSNEDCWKIFLFHAGFSDVDPCLQKIGEEIVQMCKGVPLAVRSLGAVLRGNRDPETWNRIRSSHVWSKELRDNILPGLWLSYSCLSSRLKQCFSYFSVFPKDYRIEKEDTILLWMAEGFLQTDEKEKTMEDVGKECFDELVARSLLQRSSRDESTFVMHDLVHDLAMFVSGEFCFRFDGTMRLEQLTKRTRYLSTDGRAIDPKFWKGRFEARHLRSFIRLSSSYQTSSFHQELVQEVLEGGSCLRVLSHAAGTEIPMSYDSFKKLKHLRYLNLRGREIEELPSSICNLYDLQTLVLSHCKHLTRLPEHMGRLIHLRHLDITDTPLQGMPPLMGNLKELQTLTDFVVSEHGSGSSIKELEALQHLGRKLQISELQNVDNVDNIPPANYLMNKEKLNELVLVWNGDGTETGREKKVLDALKPPQNLLKLEIRGYADSSFLDWGGGFSRLKRFRFDHCPNLAGSLPNFEAVESLEIVESCKSLPLDSFPKLKELVLQECKSLKELIVDSPDVIETLQIEKCNKLEFPGSHHYVHVKELQIHWGCDSMKTLPLDYFPRLEKLHLEGCQNLESLTFTEEICIALQSLLIAHCENLRSLPEHMHRLLPSLSHMHMCNCPEIEAFPKGGLPSNLKTLGIEECCKLVAQSRHWNLQGLTSLRGLYIGGCEDSGGCEDIMLDSFPEGLLPSSLTSFSLWEFPHLKSLNGSAFQNVKCLQELGLRDCNKLQLLPREVLLPTSLRSLSIDHCRFLERRYQEGKGEDWHQISHIPDIYIDGVTTDKLERNKGEDWHQISHIPDKVITGVTTRALKRKREEGSTSTKVKKMKSKCI